MKAWRLPAPLVVRMQTEAPWSLLWAVVRSMEPGDFTPSEFIQMLAVGVDTGFPEETANEAYALADELLGMPCPPFEREWANAAASQAWARLVNDLWLYAMDEPEDLRAQAESRVLDVTLIPPPLGWKEGGA